MSSFCTHISQKHKNTDDVDCLLAFFGSVSAKAARKKLVDSAPGKSKVRPAQVSCAARGVDFVQVAAKFVVRK